jgi:hypothetical protein
MSKRHIQPERYATFGFDVIDKYNKYSYNDNMKRENKYTMHYFKRLYFEIGSNYDDYQTIEILNENNILKIIYNTHKRISNRNKITALKIKDYSNFFNTLININIENWDKKYPYILYTGYNWKFKLYCKPSIVYEIEGSNNYPNNFSQLINLLKVHLPEFNPDINVKTTLNENDLLKLYCTHYSGTIFTEVSLGDKNIFGDNSKERRIDLVRIDNAHHYFNLNYSDRKDFFVDIINNRNYIPEIIEIKVRLNRLVIGQIIIGEYMFKKKFKIESIKKTILYHEGDEAIEIFCKYNNINLVQY